MSTITLPNIRVGSDLQVRVRLKDGGVAIDWSTLQNIKACIYSDAQRALAGRCAFSIDEEDSTLLVCTYAANKPQYLGVNRIVISAKYMGETKTYDKPAFSFVRWTADQEGEEITIDDPDVDVEIDVEDISSSILQEAVDAAFEAADRANDAAAAAEHMVDIHTGPEGKSAYEVAVEEGYTGTEEEWLASLVGPQGQQGIQGETGEAAGFGTVSAALQEDGGDPSVVVAASGPDTAKQFDFTFKNLKGEKGDKGDQGNSGYTGAAGELEVVNNLTDGGAAKALSAEMGKTLEGEVSQLEAKVTGFAWTEGKYLNSSGNEVADAAWGYTDFIPYTQGNDVIWKWGNAGSVPSGRTINFYKADKTYISGGYWSVSGQTGQKTISAAGIASDAGQAAYIRASFKLGEDASVTIGNSVAWKNSIGLESKVNANTEAIGVLEETVEENTVIVETNPISVLDTLAETYISNANGDLSTFNGYNTRVYDVENVAKVLVTLVKSTDVAAAKQFGFYSATSSFAAGNALLIGDSMGSSMVSGTTELTVPSGAKRLLLVNYSDTVTQSASSKETKSVVEVVGELDTKIDDKTTVTKIESLSPFTTESGKYITADGSLSSYSGYAADVYDVEDAAKVFITLSKISGTASRQYAFYSSKTTFDSSTALLVGPNTGSSSVVSGTTEVNVPDGALSLMLINYSGAISQSVTSPVKQDIKDIVLQLSATDIKKKAVKYDGTNLLIAYLDGTTEYCYWFKKCLANDLFTFYLVGYRTVTRLLPSTDGITTEDGITAINRANSDNIGPISMYPGGYVGGNHLYNDTVKTAKTDSVAIFVDGKELTDNDSHYCDTVSVNVVNTFYDPSVDPGEGATILTTKLATETEKYLIVENNIQVSVSIDFVSDAPGRVSNYYGMQSMCVSETGVLTPNGALASAFSLPSSTSFTKADYPNFNRFIEKKDSDYYQSTYLIPNKDGDHGQIDSTDPIFVRGSTGKDYHQIAIGGLAAGRRIVWSGVYTFLKTVVADDSDILAYTGIVNGERYLFVASKRVCSVNIPVPEEYLFTRCDIVEKVGDIDTGNEFVDVDGIRIDATGTGSLIISFRP